MQSSLITISRHSFCNIIKSVKKVMKIALVTFGMTLIFGCSSGALQQYAVEGTLLCGTVPAAKVKVLLVDKDFGRDDTLDSKETDSEGKFHLKGQTSEWSDIDVRLKIYHDCNDDYMPGQRRWNMALPKKYIKHGNGEPTVVNIGTVNLEPTMYEEERDYGI